MKRILAFLIALILVFPQTAFAQDEEKPPKIPILEYHNFGEVDSRWTRSYDKFREDLEWLYNNDYRAITIDRLMNLDFKGVQEGMKPVIITFDDSSKYQLKAAEIMDEFLLEHPDFGSAATFFVLPYGFDKDQLQYLIDTGRQIESHTYGHENLDSVTAELLESTLTQIEESLGMEFDYLAYPNGLVPKEANIETLAKHIEGAFLVGADASYLPNNEKFDPYRIPRIQAIDDEWLRHFKRQPGETEKSELEETFKPYKVGDPLAPIIKYPYQKCKPFEIERNSFGSTAWKWLKYKAEKIKVNVPPEDLNYKNNKFYYTITGEEPDSIAEKFFDYSRHYRISDFKNAIVAANPESEFGTGDEIIIPDIPKFLIKQNINVDDPWGIYFTAYTASSNEGPRLADQLKEKGGQLIIFDVKEIDGQVYFPTTAQLAHDTNAQDKILYPNLENYVRYWHDKGIYLAARLVAFKDINLASARPDLAIQSVNGGPWANREGVVWVDPSNEETQNYILTLVEDLAKAGVDEIQFDYIRFPTLGPVNQTAYNFDEASIEKYEVIRNFIARVHDRLKPYESKLSMDVYGVIVWNNEYDSQSTGQKMGCLGPYIDVVYPMVYPSHFGPGFAGFANPGDEPYYFVQESMALFNKYLEGTKTAVRPWLQAFAWRVNNYGQWYIDEQIKAAYDEGAKGYALWNAGNNYF
jgi:peptidoglycan/xylan/chitin deacetylase (PgdA/CDA1 family)